MKALTLTQPWASLVVEGRKRIETRSWSTKYRGLLAIHASKVVDSEFCADNDLIRRYPLGAVLGTVELMDCVPMTQDWIEAFVSGEETKWGLFRPGRYAWLLGAAREWSTVYEIRGWQGLWNFGA